MSHDPSGQAPDQRIQPGTVAAARTPARTLEGLSKDLSKDFGSVQFHHQRMDAFAAITDRWLAVANSARGHTAIAAWAQSCPSLAAYLSPADLVDTINQRGHPQRSCALLADLLLVAEDDPLAQLAVLRALIPGLRRVVGQRWKNAKPGGPWRTQADLAADAVSVAWEAIRHHVGRTHPLPARLIVRRVERRLRTIHDAERRDTLRAVPTLDTPSVVASCHEHLAGEDRFADALVEALASGQLDQASAAVAYRIAILGEPLIAAGRHHRLGPGRTRESLRLVLDVLAGATRAPTATHRSRPAINAPTEEVPLVPTIHQQSGDRATPAVTPLLLTVNQAAQMLGIGRSTVYEIIDADQIRSVKVGASRRIPLKAVHEYVDRLLGDDAETRGDELPSLTVAWES